MSILVLTKLLAMKEMEMKNGRITIFGRSAIFLPAEMMIKLHELIEKESGEDAADRIIRDMGKEQTKGGSRKYLERKREFASMVKKVPHTGDAGMEMGRDMLKFIGMGEIDTSKVNRNPVHVILTTRNSPYAHEYLKIRGKSRKPVCHHLKGLLMGIVEGVGNVEVEANEISCMATGISSECVFEFREKINRPR